MSNLLKDQEQYKGWPITLSQEDNYGRLSKAYLPTIKIEGLNNPVIQIINKKRNEIIYSLRLNNNRFVPKVFDDSVKYTVKVGEPDTNTWQLKDGISPGKTELIFKIGLLLPTQYQNRNRTIEFFFKNTIFFP